MFTRKLHTLRKSAIRTVQYGPILHCSSPYIFNGASPKLWDKYTFSSSLIVHHFRIVSLFRRMTIELVQEDGLQEAVTVESTNLVLRAERVRYIVEIEVLSMKYSYFCLVLV